MSKEQLEEIKEWYEFNHGKSEWKVVSIQRKDFKWFIEQAEQNKRYREALSLLNRVAAADYKSYIDTDANFVVDVTSEALEESE